MTPLEKYKDRLKSIWSKNSDDFGVKLYIMLDDEIDEAVKIEELFIIGFGQFVDSITEEEWNENPDYTYKSLFEFYKKDYENRR